MPRTRLYIQVYVTVLSALALAAIALATFAYVGGFDRHDPIAERVGRFASAMLSDTASPQQRSEILSRLSKGLDADISIYDSDDRLLDRVGDPITSTNGLGPLIFHGMRTFSVNLDNGGRVVINMNRRLDPNISSKISVILIIAAAIGIAAYPAVRIVTRRLEQLRSGVETWGMGALATRVPVNGCDEVARVAESFNRAADRVEALITSQKALLANASHELRSPLARLRMAAEMFNGAPTESLKEEIVRNLAELDELVDEILLKSRLDSNQRIDVDQVFDMLEIAAEEGAAVGAEIHGDSLPVTGNEKLLRRAVRNLLQNAQRHGKAPIDIYLSNENDKATIAVCDQGEGLQQADANRVFEPFYRPEGRAEAAGGWGLGLALVSEIAKAHAGRAWYSRIDGKGSCFTLEIPCLHRHATASSLA